MNKAESILAAMSELGGEADHYQVAKHLEWGIGKAYSNLKKMVKDGQLLQGKRGRNLVYRIETSVKPVAKKLETENLPEQTDGMMDLVGRMLHFPFSPAVRRNRCGWYLGKILKIITYKRTGKIRFIIVGISDSETRQFTKKMKLHPEEFAAKRASIEICGKRLNVYGVEIEEQSINGKAKR